MKSQVFYRHSVVLLLITALLACKTETGKTPNKMDWWKKARFGMFIHWGIYSVPAGVYHGKEVPGIGEWIMNTAKIPVKEYAKYASEFDPVKFNADRWVKLAKEAGMKYIVITAKHHDGFAMFHSKVDSFNIYDATSFKRDPLKELAAACKKYGIRLGFYYSQAQDWHHPGGAAIGGHWDSLQNGNMDEYIDKIAVPQVRELLSNYGKVSILWWDTPKDMTPARAKKFLPLLKLQPGIITNNRLGGGVKGDFETPEQFIPDTGIPGKNWETCMTMNDTWGYKKNDNDWKSAQTLVRDLIDIVSKGGNYLLNVGPTALGQIPDSEVVRLNKIGNWMKVNSQAIYGTQASPFKHLAWGRCTQKRDDKYTTLYFHIFDFSAGNKLDIPGLHNKIVKIYALADKAQKEIPYKIYNANIILDLSGVTHIKYATVLVVKIKGTPVVYDAPEMKASAEIFIDTVSVKFHTDIPGAEIHYTTDGSEPLESSPVYSSKLQLHAVKDIIVKAACFRDGKALSGVSEKTFRKVIPSPAISAKHTKPGINYAYYEGIWDHLPDFSTLKAKNKGVTQQVDLTHKQRKQEYGLSFNGYINIPVSGVYTFYLESDDGSDLIMDGNLTIDNNGQHAMIEKSVQVALAKGLHKITVNFFQNAGGDGLVLSWQGPRMKKQIIGEKYFFHV